MRHGSACCMSVGCCCYSSFYVYAKEDEYSNDYYFACLSVCKLLSFIVCCVVCPPLCISLWLETLRVNLSWAHNCIVTGVINNNFILPAHTWSGRRTANCRLKKTRLLEVVIWKILCTCRAISLDSSSVQCTFKNRIESFCWWGCVVFKSLQLGL